MSPSKQVRAVGKKRRRRQGNRQPHSAGSSATGERTTFSLIGICAIEPSSRDARGRRSHQVSLFYEQRTWLGAQRSARWKKRGGRADRQRGLCWLAIGLRIQDQSTEGCGASGRNRLPSGCANSA